MKHKCKYCGNGCYCKCGNDCGYTTGVCWRCNRK